MNDHIVIEAPRMLHCLACGAMTALPLPLPITEVVKRADMFAAHHRRCRPLAPASSSATHPLQP